jgi:ATP-dependent RNA helicase DeaD
LESFDELGLQPALVEALAQEGLERPTSLQRSLIPVLRRGSSAVAEAAPGSGLFVAFGVPLLDRLEAGAPAPSALVLTATRDRAGEMATSLARLALATGHRVGALGVPWSRPSESDIVFTTPEDLNHAVGSAALKLEGLKAVVLEGAEFLLGGDGRGPLGGVFEGAAEPLQVVVIADKLTPTLRRWVDDHARRAVFVPPEAARGEEPPAAPTTRGTVRVHVSAEDVESVVPGVVHRLLLEGHAHVLVYARTIDDAADLGDALGLHGFAVGRPGESESAVWLGVDPLEARDMIATSAGSRGLAAVVSADTPTDADELDRRHGGSPGGVIVASPRTLAHLRRIAREAGYVLEPDPSGDARDSGELARFRASIEAALEQEDLAPYLLLLEPLLRRRSGAEVAAALAALLRRRDASAGAGGTSGAAGSTVRPPAWSRIFLSVGLRDGVGAGDVLGAILGEAGVEKDQVGRIDLKDTFTRVEVHDSVAERVIRALNGTSLRGRSVRADFDRGESRSSAASRERGKRPGRDRGLPKRGPGRGGRP